MAVVSGANRGIGREVCRQLADRGYTVVLGSRDLVKGEAAARELTGEIHPRQLDVTDPQSRLGGDAARRRTDRRLLPRRNPLREPTRRDLVSQKFC